MEKFQGIVYTLISVLLLWNFVSQSIAEEVSKFLTVGHEHGKRGKNSEACNRLIPNCEECFDATWCSKCKQGYIALESFWGMECVRECPAGYYEDSYRRVCFKTLGCKQIYNCAECSERYLAVDSYKCDRCQAGYFLFAAVLEGETTCVEECPAGYKQHGRRCRHVGCADFFCNSCEKGWVLQHKGVNKEHATCVRQCPKGFFKQVDYNSKDAVCVKCKLHCRSCHVSVGCNKCEEGYALLKKEFSASCVENCPPGYRLVKKKSHHPAICTLDRKGCLDKRCHKCSEGFFYIKKHGISQCREDCPKGYFKSEVRDFKLAEQRRCLKCVHKCQTCTNEKNCQTCDEGFKKLVFGPRNRTYCIQSCPVGYDTIEDQEGHEMCLNPNEPKLP